MPDLFFKYRGKRAKGLYEYTMCILTNWKFEAVPTRLVPLSLHWESSASALRRRSAWWNHLRKAWWKWNFGSVFYSVCFRIVGASGRSWIGLRGKGRFDFPGSSLVERLALWKSPLNHTEGTEFLLYTSFISFAPRSFLETAQSLCSSVDGRYPFLVFASLFGTACPRRKHLVDPASSHMLVSKIKPCMSKYNRYTGKLRMAH